MQTMAKRKKSISKTRSPKLLKRDRCMKTEVGKQKEKILKTPSGKRLSPRKLHQKAFGDAMKVCSTR